MFQRRKLSRDVQLRLGPPSRPSTSWCGQRGLSAPCAEPQPQDPRHYGVTRRGHAKTGPTRARFLLESLADLRARLRALGSDLLVLRETPERGLLSLAAAASSPCLVLVQEEPASEEAAVAAAVEAALAALPGGHALLRVWGRTLLHRDDLPFEADLSDLPPAFTPFRTAVEDPRTGAPIRDVLPTAALPAGALPLPPAAQLAAAGQLDPLPGLGDLGFSAAEAAAAAAPDPRAVLVWRGGETAALARLEHFIWGCGALATYFDTRDALLGADGSSKLSPWVAHGCLSPRLVAAECRRFERERVRNKSTYWLVNELIWRDYLHFCSLAHGVRLFQAGGFAGVEWEWRADPAGFAAWKAGRTGYPLVDAAMRELAATGFTSNRGRQVVASFLTQMLGVDWRLGAEHFEASLDDYDCASNWGNWQLLAGVTGGRVNVFNPQKQSRDYDAEGAYVRTWLPELARVPLKYVHTPWQMPPDVQLRSGCVLGADYPRRLSEEVRGPAGGAGSDRGKGNREGGKARDQRRGTGGKSDRRSNARGRMSEFERYD